MRRTDFIQVAVPVAAVALDQRDVLRDPGPTGLDAQQSAGPLVAAQPPLEALHSISVLVLVFSSRVAVQQSDQFRGRLGRTNPRRHDIPVLQFLAV